MHCLGKTAIDRVRVMGVINVSPESFYKKSVKVSHKEIAKAASQIEEYGADFIDIGAMSTAPYLKTMITAEKEVERVKVAVKAVRDASSLPISIDTPRAMTADVALEMGATIVNDVTGLKFDPEMARTIHEHDASVIVCAYEKRAVSGKVRDTVNALRESIRIAVDANIRTNGITIDPAIGFFREKGNNPFFTKIKGTSWFDRDLILINRLGGLRVLRRPICVSVSRKSFIGRILDLDPGDRLFGSIAAEAICVLNGANIIRSHNVAETTHAVKIAETLLKLV